MSACYDLCYHCFVAIGQLERRNTAGNDSFFVIENVNFAFLVSEFDSRL